MPIVKTKGAASSQGFGEFAQASTVANYIEDVFSTYLYTGNGSTQTITNGIDLAGKGGLVWQKDRVSAGTGHYFQDTTRGVQKYVLSNSTAAEVTNSGTITSFNSNGYTVGGNGNINGSGEACVSWTFRKQPKFFDVVTYTGTGSTQNIAHSLGSVPGCIIVKKTSGAASWCVYHTSLGNAAYINLNLTDAASTSQYSYFYGGPSSTTFTVGAASDINESGQTFVAYLFAHNAGGFGLTGTDNVISCGSFTTDGSGNATVSLGYEPQWVMFKNSAATGSWRIYDSMRGIATGGVDAVLFPNLTAAEDTGSDAIDLTATGFLIKGQAASNAHIYIAIRRGPMKVPTSGTSVFSPNYASSTTGQQITTGFPVDSQILRYLPSGIGGYWFDRLRGVSTTTTESGQALYPNATTAETTENYTRYFNNTGYQQNSGFAVGTQMIGYSFGRAPGFFDEVCFNGSDTDFTVNHNLQAIPELIILKKRSGTGSWFVGGTIVGFNSANNNNNLFLNNTNAISTATVYTATWTSSAMYMSGGANFVAGTTAVAYLFATCAGVSKVGSYTGNGSTQTINCGFTGGARFVLIKRTDATGDWYVYDTARGMTVLTDPYLRLNSTAAETATLGSVTTVSTGFAVDASILAAVNTNGASYIFFAVA